VSENLNKLKAILREMFQLDQADLDFGIYRIMNQKREEIEQFLDRYLLPQVKTAFAQFKGEDLQAVCDELDKRLESYEDALNNLQLKRSPEQGSLLEQHDSLREQYMLSYMLMWKALVALLC